MRVRQGLMWVGLWVIGTVVMAEAPGLPEAEALAFEPFDWMGEEIGGNARYRNNVLARLGRVPEEGELGGEKG